MHVLIAAEREPTRVGMLLALEEEARCTEVVDAESAVALALRERPDVCLLGFETPGWNLRALDAIVAEAPSAVVVLFTDEEDEDEVMAALRGGASGCLPLGLEPSRLPHVVRGVLRGETVIPRRVVSRLVEELRGRERRRSLFVSGQGPVTLTAREWEVAERLLRGASTAEIAAELGLVPVTVRRHLGSVQRKLGVTTRADVVRLLAAAPEPGAAPV